jgi:hypothetical protein
VSYFEAKSEFEKARKNYEQAANLLASQVEAMLAPAAAVLTPGLRKLLTATVEAFRESESGADHGR